MLGFIGIGQCGSNIAEVAEKSFGYRSFVINTSEEDLCTVEISSKLKIGSESGAAKNRNLAKEVMKNNYKEILNNLKNKFKPDSDDEKIIFVCFSSSGGTGSGIGPMLIELLKKMYTDKSIVAVTVLPTEDEAPSMQYNCIECLTEIFKLDIPVILIDNQKVKDEYNKISKAKLFNKINNELLSNINEFFIERNYTKYGTIDSQEVFKLFSTSGVLTFATSDLNKEKTSDLMRHLFEGLEYNIYADLAVDKKISRMGIIYELGDKYLKDINLETLYKEIGKPIDVYEGYYKPENTDFQKVILLTAGTVLPKERIDMCKKILNDAKEEIQKEVTVDIDLSDIGWISKNREGSKAGLSINNDIDTLDNILKKY